MNNLSPQQSPQPSKLKTIVNIFVSAMFALGLIAGLFMYGKTKSQTMRLERERDVIREKVDHLKTVQLEHSKLTFDVLRRNTEDHAAMTIVQAAFGHTKDLKDVPVSESPFIVTAGCAINGGFEYYIYAPRGKHFLELNHSMLVRWMNRSETHALHPKEWQWVDSTKAKVEFASNRADSKQNAIALIPNSNHRLRYQFVTENMQSKLKVELTSAAGKSLFNFETEYASDDTVLPRIAEASLAARASLPGQLSAANSDDALSRSVFVNLPIGNRAGPGLSTLAIDSLNHELHIAIKSPDIEPFSLASVFLKFTRPSFDVMRAKFKIDEDTGRLLPKQGLKTEQNLN